MLISRWSAPYSFEGRPGLVGAWRAEREGEADSASRKLNPSSYVSELTGSCPAVEA